MRGEEEDERRNNPGREESKKWRMRMESSRVVRASDNHCRSRNCPGFDPSILRHSGIWGAADEAVHRKNQQQKICSQKETNRISYADMGQHRFHSLPDTICIKHLAKLSCYKIIFRQYFTLLLPPWAPCTCFMFDLKSWYLPMDSLCGWQECVVQQNFSIPDFFPFIL